MASSTTRIGFRSRPIHPDYAVSQQTSKALRGARSYQRQHITLPDAYQNQSIVVGAFSNYTQVALMPADVIVSAYVAIGQLSATTTYDLEINGTLQGANLGGTWSACPNQINIKPYAVPAADSPVGARLYVRVKNVSGQTATFGFQLIVTVLR